MLYLKVPVFKKTYQNTYEDTVETKVHITKEKRA